MSEDLFSDTVFGKLARKKLDEQQILPNNFKLFEAGWVEENPDEFNTFLVKGQEYRVAQGGPNKGKLCIPIPGTVRSVCLTRKEIMTAPYGVKV